MYQNEGMFKEELLLSEGSNIKDDKLEERVVIRIKRKGQELPASLIYLKKPNRGILEGEFFKHIETTELDEAEGEGVKKVENVDTFSFFFKNKQIDLNDEKEDSSSSHKKRKHLSLKNYESDLEGAINKLKKCKVTNQTVQFVDVSGVKKRLKVIDVDLSIKEKGIVVNKDGREKEEEKEDKEEVGGGESETERVMYDFYVLDDEKLSIEKYMDYFYDIKHANVNTGDILVLDDMYGNTVEEYVNESFNPSVCSETSSFKELSDYPEEMSTDEHCSDGNSSEAEEDEEDEEYEEDEEDEEAENEEREHSNSDINECESEEFYTYGNYDMCAYPEDVILLEPPEDDDTSCYRDICYDEPDDNVEDEVDEVEWEDFDIEEDDGIIRSDDVLTENKHNDSIVVSKDDMRNET